MAYTLGKAAEAVGKSKSTLSKAIKNGVISAQKQKNGSFKIDPSELFRVFPKKNTETVEIEQKETPKETRENSIELAVLRVKLDAAERQIDELKEDRDKWRQQASFLLEDKRKGWRWPWQNKG